MPPAPGNVKGQELKSETLAEGKVKYRLVHLSFGPEGKTWPRYRHFHSERRRSLSLQSSPPAARLPVPRRSHVNPMVPIRVKGQNVLMLVGSDPAKASPPRERPAAKAEELAKYFALQLGRGYAVVVFNNNDCAEDNHATQCRWELGLSQHTFLSRLPRLRLGCFSPPGPGAPHA